MYLDQLSLQSDIDFLFVSVSQVSGIIEIDPDVPLEKYFDRSTSEGSLDIKRITSLWKDHHVDNLFVVSVDDIFEYLGKYTQEDFLYDVIYSYQSKLGYTGTCKITKEVSRLKCRALVDTVNA